jgi:ABC-type multidrug transport system fused ATPase/permease subunit
MWPAALLCGQLHRPNVFQDAPKIRLQPEAHGSISAVSSVIREGVLAAALTGLMILLFVGNWRSTLIVAVSIPLAILLR